MPRWVIADWLDVYSRCRLDQSYPRVGRDGEKENDAVESDDLSDSGYVVDGYEESGCESGVRICSENAVELPMESGAVVTVMPDVDAPPGGGPGNGCVVTSGESVTPPSQKCVGAEPSRAPRKGTVLVAATWRRPLVSLPVWQHPVVHCGYGRVVSCYPLTVLGSTPPLL